MTTPRPVPRTPAAARRLAGSTVRNTSRGLLLAGLALYALNLRGPITAMAPVISTVSSDLHLTPAAAGLLTGLPVLCYALVTPLAATLINRAGTAVAGMATLLGVLVGTVLRSSGGFATALVGTAFIGAAITVGNVAIPVVAARDFASGVSGVMGATTAAMNVGAVATTIGMAPLAAVIGWRWALASWALVAIVALVVWWRASGFRARPARSSPAGRVPDERTHGVPGTRKPALPGERTPALPDEPAAPLATAPRRSPHSSQAAPGEPAGRRGVAAGTARTVLRRPLTWLLAATFAFQSASYYALSAWLPTLLHDEVGMSRTGAGAAASVFQGLGILGGVLAPVMMARLHPRAITATITLAWLALPVGLLLAPGLWPVWTSLGGTAQAANYVVIFSVVSTVAGSPAAAGRMSATVQTVGYVLAGVAPTILGAVHTATSGWRAPLLVVALALLAMAAMHTVAMGGLTRWRAAHAADAT